MTRKRWQKENFGRRWQENGSLRRTQCDYLHKSENFVNNFFSARPFSPPPRKGNRAQENGPEIARPANPPKHNKLRPPENTRTTNCVSRPDPKPRNFPKN